MVRASSLHLEGYEFESCIVYIKKDINKMIQTSIAVQSEIRERSFLSSSCVNPTKIGTVPMGFKTENRAKKR